MSWTAGVTIAEMLDTYRAGRAEVVEVISSVLEELASTEAEIGEFIANVGVLGEILEVVRSGVLGMARSNPRLHVVK